MIRFKSLQQRFSVFMLLPVALLLIGMGFSGFTYARNQLLTQWGEATILKLQRAAHHVDMRLSKPKEMMDLFLNSAGMMHAAQIQSLVIDQLKKLEWVTSVDLKLKDENSDSTMSVEMLHHILFKRGANEGEVQIEETVMMRPFHHGNIIDVTPPRFDTTTGSETVSLVSDLMDNDNHIIGQLNVKILFRDLVDRIEATGWWQDHKALLVDNTGEILTSNLNNTNRILDQTRDSLEHSTLYAMKSSSFGTVFGKGFPPKEASGFYKLKEAPWTLVMVVPGKEFLSPIIKFRIYFFIVGGIFILIILILIRFVTGYTVSSIKEVSEAANKIAGGDYDISLQVKTRDEVGELNESFNTMVQQLKDRAYLKSCLNLAKDVQQNLLPDKSMKFKHQDIAGQSLYCDETGGDYYDFFEFPGSNQSQVGIAVGDVAGHGIAAALFMTTVRALIRSRVIQKGKLSEIVSDVNRLLCIDTSHDGNFMTLFLILFDTIKNEIRWVRAGHDPAILYDASRDEFFELNGKGIAIGINEEWSYREYSRNGWNDNQVVLIGTDGIWETENPQGEQFGKDRLRELLRKNSQASAKEILKHVTDSLIAFRKNRVQDDDITLVVIKAKP